LPNEDRRHFQTVAGFVLDTLGRIPIAGDSFEWNDLYIEVLDMDSLRVDKILVKPGAKSAEETP
jgi:putative hemolysin